MQWFQFSKKSLEINNNNEATFKQLFYFGDHRLLNNFRLSYSNDTRRTFINKACDMNVPASRNESNILFPCSGAACSRVCLHLSITVSLVVLVTPTSRHRYSPFGPNLAMMS
eukprot:15003_1